ncbi:MAG: hydrogenase iron-sulfur subunit, partial [Desulfobacterales bacterium]|nr:hydrogenase iron-sulfur subunit [Desulfobacterales bacterium]
SECNYTTHGNFDAFAVAWMARRILKLAGINPDRLALEFMSGADGQLLAEKTDEFTRRIKSLGPLWVEDGENPEGMDADQVRFKLQAALRLVPYLKLVERERLRVAEKSKAAYTAFFKDREVKNLFDEIVEEKFALSQIMLLLDASSLSTGDLSRRLGMSPSEVARHMKTSSRQGLVRFNTREKCYEPAL